MVEEKIKFKVKLLSVCTRISLLSKSIASLINRYGQRIRVLEAAANSLPQHVIDYEKSRLSKVIKELEVIDEIIERSCRDLCSSTRLSIVELSKCTDGFEKLYERLVYGTFQAPSQVRAEILSVYDELKRLREEYIYVPQ